MLILGYRGSFNVDYFFIIMHSDRMTDGRNILNLSNEGIDAALDKAKTTIDTDARTQEYIKCQQIAHDEVVVVPLYSGTVFNISPKNLAGVQLLPTSGSDHRQIHWVE